MIECVKVSVASQKQVTQLQISVYLTVTSLNKSISTILPAACFLYLFHLGPLPLPQTQVCFHVSLVEAAACTMAQAAASTAAAGWTPTAAKNKVFVMPGAHSIAKRVFAWCLDYHGICTSHWLLLWWVQQVQTNRDLQQPLDCIALQACLWILQVASWPKSV